MPVVLYSYFRSSAAYRVRIALNLKNLEYTIHPVHLLKNGGEQNRSEYLQINPQGLIPALQTDHALITESAAIIEYLEECYPHPPLLPDSLEDRAFVRSLAQMIACDIHPLNNLRVLNYLRSENNAADQKNDWVHHWLEQGLSAFETRIARSEPRGRFCFGNTPSLADLFLIPQAYNALRFHHSLESYPFIHKIYQNCLDLNAFSSAAPDMQSDAPASSSIL